MCRSWVTHNIHTERTLKDLNSIGEWIRMIITGIANNCHGGRRSNSGPKCQNQRLGEPVARMQRIEAFFSNPPVQAAEPVAPPETQVHQTNGPSTAAQDVDGTADQETDKVVGQITNADLRLPNYNAEEYHLCDVRCTIQSNAMQCPCPYTEYVV